MNDVVRDPRLRQRNPRYENRKLLDIAHEAPCMLRLPVHGCGNHLSVPCHNDQLEHGRGASYKSHDYYAVPGCPACHAAFTRALLGRERYEEVWFKALIQYLAWLWENNKIKVAR